MKIYYLKNKIRNASLRNEFIKSVYALANKIKAQLLLPMSDKSFAKLKYFENTGRKLNLENPVTFNEKLWWLILNNRDPLLTTCSDKYKVRDYVRACGLEHILTKLYGVYSNANEIEFDKIPDKIFIKTNHGSGMNIIYHKNRPFNKESFIKKFNSLLKQNYYWQTREWNYKNIVPKLICEEVLEDRHNPSLLDYRFFCFDGKVKLIFVDMGLIAQDGSHSVFARRNVYDVDFNYLDVKLGKENFDKSLITKPENFEKMIEYAEILSKPFPHCRIDLYNVEGKIYFGEITFYHASGIQSIIPEEWNIKMGDWINLNSNKIVLT